MKKSAKFKINLIDKNLLYIPQKIAEPFLQTKDKRAKFKLNFKDREIEFYGALKKDKISDAYKLMFSKQKQKELNLSLGDEFKMQLFEDTSKYGVDVPEELEEVFLTDYEAFKIFETLTKGKQRSIIYGLIRFKTSQQKIDKALIMCENLKQRNFEPMKMFKLE